MAWPAVQVEAQTKQDPEKRIWNGVRHFKRIEGGFAQYY